MLQEKRKRWKKKKTKITSEKRDSFASRTRDFGQQKSRRGESKKRIFNVLVQTFAIWQHNRKAVQCCSIAKETLANTRTQMRLFGICFFHLFLNNKAKSTYFEKLKRIKNWWYSTSRTDVIRKMLKVKTKEPEWQTAFSSLVASFNSVFCVGLGTNYY